MNSLPAHLKHVLLTTVILLVTPSFISPDMPDSYDRLWEQIESFTRKGLPRSAMQELDKLHDQAMAEKNHPQLLKATLYRFGLWQDFEEDPLIKSIDFALQTVPLLSSPASEILHSIIAELYWMYYQQERYSLMNRSPTTGLESEDIREWDLTRLRDTIEAHYAASLRSQALLDTIPLKKFTPVLHTASDEAWQIQPRVFGFVATRALDYYMNRDAGLQDVIPEKALQDEALWLPAAQFAAFKLPTTSAGHAHILSLMQQLLASNLRQQQQEAMIHNELKRFRYLKQYYEPHSKADTLYLKALLSLQERNAHHPASALIAADRAALLIEQAKLSDKDTVSLAQAVEICRKAIEAHPKSRGAALCKSYKEQILETELNLTIQRVEQPQTPIAVRLEYRNLTQPAFRIVRIKSETLQEIMEYPELKARQAAVLKLKPDHQWSLELPFEPDYKSHSTIIDLPPLDNGLYLLIAAQDSSFKSENQVVFTSFQVSRLSFVQLKRNSVNHFYIIDRINGKAVANADVQLITREYDYNIRKYIQNTRLQLKSGKDGSFVVAPQKQLPTNQAFMIEVFTKNDTLYSDNYFDVYERKPNTRTQNKTWFFTDRAIYRPGQTVFFKGITLEKQANQAEWKLKEPHSTKLRFLDVNRKEISTQTLYTNTYGSFEGHFTIPQDLLTGTMMISNESGSVLFHVEYYKRPDFETSLEAEAEQYGLGDTVSIRGLAKAYAGYGLDHVEVRYTVERKIYYPYWPWWRGWPPFDQQSKHIASGATQTSADGSFQIRFVAEPEARSTGHDYTAYSYTITADVVDRNGETRSGKLSIQIGEINLLMQARITEVVQKGHQADQSLQLVNLQQKPVNAMVTTRFYRLRDERTVLRPSIFSPTDRQILASQKLEALFPLDGFTLETEPDKQPKELVYEYERFVNGSLHIFPDDISSWSEGSYLVEFVAQDIKGQEVRLLHPFLLFDAGSSRSPSNETAWFYLDKKTAEPGDTLHLYLSSAAGGSRVLVEITAGEEIRYSRWHKLSKKKLIIPYIVSEADRGHLQIQALAVSHNRSHHLIESVEVPYTNKKLDITLETVRQPLKPGAEETWIIHIRGKQKEAIAAELLASLYDASLDQFASHHWAFTTIERKPSAHRWMTDNGFLTYTASRLTMPKPHDYLFPPLEEIRLNWFGLSENRYWRANGRPVPLMSKEALIHDDGTNLSEQLSGTPESKYGDSQAEMDFESEEDIPQASSLRSDFRETAFFFPQLHTDSTGNISLHFTLPDALTKWKLMLLAHTQDMSSGLDTYTFEASKELMVVPNHARFYREGDTVWLTAKVVNMSDKTLNGIASLELSDAVSNELLPYLLTSDRQPVANLRPGQSKQIRWKAVLDGTGLMAVRYSISAGAYSDSEEQWIPLLPSGVIIRETLPLSVPAHSSKSFDFSSITKPVEGEKNLSLTLQYSNHPVWYAIQALPYLHQQQNASIDQMLYRFYANSLAAYIAKGIPSLMQTIESWKMEGADALLSNLEKNPELKAALLDETPWVMAAAQEADQKQNLKLLFDINKMQYERQMSIQKLRESQLPDGSWPWFPGMRGNVHTTQSVLLGLGRLIELIPESADEHLLNELVRNALRYLAQEMYKTYQKIEKEKQLKLWQIGIAQIDYLWIRSLFPHEEMSETDQQVLAYFIEKTISGWPKMEADTQAKAALVLYRHGKIKEAQELLASLKERSLFKEELGVYWKHQRYGTAAAIESQAMMIAAFSQITHDTVLVDGIRQWLLLNKQTNSWPTARASSEAVFALLQYGTPWLEGQQQATISIGGHTLDVAHTQDRTGFIEKRWTASEITPDKGRVEINNPNPVVGWGGLFREYKVAVDQVRDSQTNLKIQRELLVLRESAPVPLWQPLKDNILKTGDKIKVRLIIETDRDMEFIHLRDLRAAAFEPESTLSAYQWNVALAYYQAVNDTYTDFFFDYLPRGKHLLEYTLIVMQQGEFAHGYAQLQSYYAPEFSATSKAQRVKVEGGE
ncbi:MAG: alpha-2-macroglobulin family protein [Bacteroidales bacterium]|jgi:uncharacterized protein YfaS (alpha-2-macroglobulin family)|nr:MG2 domain-containing protein [Bacteroidales bacterium]MDD3702009.1 MG2 domain-containing protein [Bacteroidales bacterium]MDY0368999.1 MG2 domain-containing protein [Bacteroidales bacterium]